MALVLKPPAELAIPKGARSLFLAGSIDMGKAEGWQATFERACAPDDFVILNPRRDAWDTSWRQSIDDARFRQQVEWELDGLERADLVAMYFAPTSRAPVTLLELGLCARNGRLVVCCGDGYWRRGNVEVVCARNGVPMVDSLDKLITEARARLGKKKPARKTKRRVR